MIDSITRKKVIILVRKQFYPDSKLAMMLSQDAVKKGVSESTLITDILNEYYGLNANSSISLTNLTQKVLDEVESYIKTLPVGVPFDLNSASATYRDIEMAQFKRPKTVRASIGRSFKSKIGKTPFDRVKISTYKDKKGNTKKQTSINNALMYEIF